MAISAVTRCLPALLLIGAGCGVLPTTGGPAAVTIPPPPPVVEGVPDPIPAPAPDGLHRFIVRPPVPLSDGGPGHDDEPVDPGPGPSVDAGPTVDAPPPPDPVWTLDQSLVDQIDDDTVVVLQDGVPGFVDRSGRFVALVGNSSASSGEPVSRGGPGPTEESFLSEIEGIEGVVSVVAIGDGSFAVVAERADALDGRGLDAVIDTPFALAGDPYQPYQWTLDNTGDNLQALSNPPPQTSDADIDGREAMAGARGQGVVVAVIDTGVDFSHPDLAGQSWVNDDEICTNLIDDDGNGYVDDCRGWDFGNEDNEPYGPSQQDHGTHVAGTIAAVAGNGIGVAGLAPEVTIMDLNVEGPGGMTLSGISRAVRYAADNGADIINMSLGTQPGTPAGAVTGLIDAVRHAEAQGVLVVVAAGNSSVDLDSSPVYPANIEGPNMITVGASAPNETKASFSNHGSPVDLFAPGVLIISTAPGAQYTFMNGTSMASPTAAAAAASVLSANPDLDPQGIRSQLLGTGDELSAYAGLAANPVRINQAWAVGIDPDPDRAQVTIGGLVSASPDEVVADITMADPGDWFDEPYHWEASLLLLADAGVYGLVDQPLTLNWQPATTDGRGAVTIGEGGDGQIRLETSLPAGTYGLVVEAVAEDDGDQRLGDAFVATFTVEEELEQPPTTPPPSDSPPTTSSPTTPPPTTSPGPTTTSGTAPSSTPSPVPSPTTRPAPTTTTTWRPTSWTWNTTTAPRPTVAPTTGSTTTAPAPTVGPTTAPPSTSGPSPTTTSAPTTAPPSRPSTPGSTPSSTTVSGPTSTTAPPTPPSTTVPTSGPPSPPPTTTRPRPPTTSADSGFAVYSINPSSGYSDQQTMVSIDGVFPSPVYVWFGDQPGDLVYHSTNWIIVVAPPAGRAGTVDVSLRSPSAGTVLLIEDGFTYLASGGGPPTTTTPAPTTSPPTTGPTTSPTTSTTRPGGGDGGSGPTTSSTAGSTPSTDGPRPGPSTTSSSGSSTVPPTTAPGSTTTAGPTPSSDPAPTTTAPTGPRRSLRASAVGEPVGLAGGLTGVPLPDFDGLREVPGCISEPCRTRPL